MRLQNAMMPFVVAGATRREGFVPLALMPEHNNSTFSYLRETNFNGARISAIVHRD